MSAIKIQNSLPLSRQKTAAEQEKKLDDAVKMYEKQFLNQMVKAMRNTVSHSKMTKPGMAEKIYQDQMYEKYVDQWSQQGGVGLSKVIKEQLMEKLQGRMMNLKPSGPMKLDPGKAIKIKPQEKLEAIPLNKESKEMSLLLPPSKANEPIVSPWEGKVSSIHRGDEGLRTLKIDHGEVSSMMSFYGTDDALKIGDELKAGQQIGKISHVDNWLAWKVT